MKHFNLVFAHIIIFLCLFCPAQALEKKYLSDKLLGKVFWEIRYYRENLNEIGIYLPKPLL